MMTIILRQFLLPFSIVVLLPIMIVSIITNFLKYKHEKKYSFLNKCIDNGVEIDPELFFDKDSKDIHSKAKLKIMLLNRLIFGIVLLCLGIGIFLLHFLLNLFNPLTSLLEMSALGMIAVGIGLMTWYFVGKKMLAPELEDNTLNNE